jgi:hypothetical protein
MTPEAPPPAEKPLSKIFNAAVAGLIKDFPHLEGRLVVANMPEDEIHGKIILPKTDFKAAEEVAEYIDRIMKQSVEKKSSLAAREKKLDLIVFNPTSRSRSLFTGAGKPQEMAILAEFDHEVGHIVIPGARGGDTPSRQMFNETAADLYACIRAVQRFGDKAEGPGVAAWQRAQHFVRYGKYKHFTSFALLELDKLRDKVDIEKLSPMETVALANRLALQYTPGENLVNVTMAAFQPYRDALNAGVPQEDAVRKLAEVTLKATGSYFTFKLGKLLLEPYLNGQVVVNGKPSLFEGAEWDAVREKLKVQSEKMEKEGILFGLPAKPPKDDPPPPPSGHKPFSAWA